MSPTYMSRVRLNWPGPSSTLSPMCRFRVVRRIGGIVVRFLGSFGGTPQLPILQGSDTSSFSKSSVEPRVEPITNGLRLSKISITKLNKVEKIIREERFTDPLSSYLRILPLGFINLQTQYGTCTEGRQAQCFAVPEGRYR